MNNVKVQTKLSIVMLATIVALVLCAVISSESMKQLQSKALETMEADERESYDEQIKQQVDNVVSLCQTIYDQYQAGVYTEEEAKKLAADEIRQLRYGEAGYFWVDQYDGTNVVLLGNDTEGTNRMETKDANGYQMVKEIIRVGQEADGAKKLLEFVGTDVVDSFAGFSDMADSYSNDAGSIDGLVTDFSASSEQLLASINGVMDAIGEVSKAATEGATGNNDIAEKTGVVVEKAAEIKEKAEAAHAAADRLQKNVERFIV